jgi:hypothetical protein|tara:strand:- start:5352 stop:5873 length:522 start_codon:yes stop_codon:yes gene_type:complete
MSIITLADYKTYSDINSPNQDNKLQYIIDFVNQYILNYCNTTFTPTVVTGYKASCFNGEDFVLPHAPVISIESITYNAEIMADTKYTLHKEEGRVESFTSFSKNRFALEVNYTHGHASVPADLKLSALEFVTYLSKREFTKSRSSSNGESSDYGDMQAIPAYIKLAMNMYKVL